MKSKFKQCKECGHQLSKNAGRCPKCGYFEGDSFNCKRCGGELFRSKQLDVGGSINNTTKLVPIVHPCIHCGERSPVPIHKRAWLGCLVPIVFFTSILSFIFYQMFNG